MGDPLTARVTRDIARLRRVRGMSDRELAERVGASVARRLAQGGELTLGELGEVARALDVEVDVRLTPRSLPRGTVAPRAMVGLLQTAILRSHDPLERYAAGEIVAAVKRDAATYGDSAVTSLAKSVGEDIATLYRFASVAECFTRAEVKRLLASGLTWSHLVALARVPDEKRRKAWTARAMRTKVSVRMLEAQLAK
jgi:hypothetical protein